MRALVAGLFVAASLCGAAAAQVADVRLDGDRLTVTTANLVVAFRGGDIVSILNRLTGEQVARRGPLLTPLLDMAMLKPPGTPLRCSGWRWGKATGDYPFAVQTTFNDLTRMVWMNVMVDSQTQDVVVTLWGEAQKEGVTGLTWGVRGLDLSVGRLVLPAQGGRCADRETMPASLVLDYPTQWEAQMLVWEGKRGGVVIYSRDDQARFKKLHLTRRGDYADVGLETEGVAPWPKNGSVPQLEWRINAYRGDWRVPALGYRNLMHFLRKPVEAKDARAWAPRIRTVVTVNGAQYDPALLDTLARRLTPAKTLLYLPQWRRDGYDVNYPDYTPADNVQPFVEKAHGLGFRVMLHTDLPGVTPTNPDFQRVGRWQVRDPRTAEPMGWYWDHPPTDPVRFAYIDPAARAYRDLFVARLRPTIEALKPDAIHLDVSGPMWNDGGGLIENKNYAQGSVALHRALLTAFPGLVLGGESMNELIAPYNWFAQRWNYGDLPPHPISDLLFGDHVLSYGYLGQPNPDDSPAGFLGYFRQYESQGVAPTPVLSTPADLGDDRQGMSRLLRAARVWQDHDVLPDWLADWKGALFRMGGSDGVPVSVERTEAGVRMRAGDETVYQRLQGVNQVATSQFIPGWPAYDDGTLYGLDPAREYWLDPVPRPKATPHLSWLSPGVRVTAAQATPGFCRFSLEPVERTAADLILGLPQATPGTIVAGKDEALAYGATASGTQTSVGGVARPGLFEHPPWQGVVGAETYVEYRLDVPPGHPALACAIGLADGSRESDGATFRVTVDGKELWRENTAAHTWQARRVDLSAYAGQPVRLRLITNAGPRNDATFDHACWSDVRLVAVAGPAAADAVLSLPAGATPVGYAGVAAPPTVEAAGLRFAALGLPASVMAFLKPGDAVSTPQDLLALPHDAAISSDGLVHSGSVYGSGSVGEATCGGVKKVHALNAHTPAMGQTVFSWLVRLPDTQSLTLTFAAGLADGARTSGVGFAVLVDGSPRWQWGGAETRWNEGSVDLSDHRGRTALIQLVTDAQGDNLFDWAKWADIIIK